MLEFEYKEELEEKYYNILDTEFNKFAIKNDLNCNYKPFSFIAKENDAIIGIITGHSYYKEVHIDDLIVLEEYRNKHIGTELVKQVENYFKDKNFKNINLTTYSFQAPDFYKKCGYRVEFIRENKQEPKLTKHFFIKEL